MLTTIEQATENFCIHQIRTNHTISDGISKENRLIAYIDIDCESGAKHRVYIASDKAFMQRIATLFLEEEESDEETLIDMLLETTNLIVGSAKVLAENAKKNLYTINTPHFEKIGLFDFEYDSARTVMVENDLLSIAIKEL
jgi:hypothetical protein